MSALLDLTEAFAVRNPLPRWQREIRSADGTVLVLSPGVSSPTAERVLLLDPNRVSLYTLFSAENFVRGTSSLSCIRKLILQGCNVFHLPDLNANAVVSPGRAYSVGSQSLTARARTRKQMTSLVRDAKSLARIEVAVQRWIKSAQPITLEMVNDMARRLPRLRRAYLALMREVHPIDGEVFGAEQRRQSAKAAEAEFERLRQRIMAASTTYSQPSAVRWCTLTQVTTGYGYNTNDTLLSHDKDLLNWSYDGRPVQLLKTYRYLMVAPESRRIGWVRVMQTRITKIEQGIQWHEPVTILGRRYQVSLSAIWEAAQLPNVEVSLDGDRYLLRGFFSVDGLDILEVSPGPSGNAGAASPVLSELEARKDEVEAVLSRRLLAPFRYSKNLTGVEASRFVSPMGSWWALRLGRHKGGWFIVATRD